MTGKKNIRKKLLSVVIILSWFLLIWNSYGNDWEWYVENRCLLGILFAMVYAPWLYACFNKRKGLNFFPELPKEWQNTLGKFNVIVNILPVLIIFLWFAIPSDRFDEEGFYEYWARRSDDFVIFSGLAYWYVSYSIYFIMKGNFPTRGFNWSYIGWLMLILLVVLILYMN